MYWLIHQLEYEFLKCDPSKGKRINNFILHIKGIQLYNGEVTKPLSAPLLYYFRTFQQKKKISIKTNSRKLREMQLEWLKSLAGLISKERLKEACMYNLAKWQLGLEAKRTVYKYLKSVNQACKTQSSATLGKWEIRATALHTAHWPTLRLGCCLGEMKSSPGSLSLSWNNH